MGALSSLTPNPTKGGHIMARDEAYYEAEKKIEEAQQSIIYHLFLNNLSLTKIPDSLTSSTSARITSCEQQIIGASKLDKPIYAIRLVEFNFQ